MIDPRESGWQARLAEWNRPLSERAFPRAEVDEILFGLDKQRLVEIRGCRGTGKSTLLRLVARRLMERGLPRGATLFVDLEDPVWAPWSGLASLEALLEGHSGATVLFLDGVERLPTWVDLARRLRAQKQMSVVAAHSGAADGAAPAGVYQVPVWPLDFPGWIRIFRGQGVDGRIAEDAWREYLLVGGLPGARRAAERRAGWMDLLFASLMRDVVLLRSVRDTNSLTAMAVYLLGRSGETVSASGLKGTVTRSVDQARTFLSHLEASGLLSLVSRIEDADRTANQAARFVFAADTGLAHALSTRSGDGGNGDGGLSSLARTAAYHQLKRMGKKVFSWRAQGRCGLAVGNPASPLVLIDVQVDEEAAIGLTPLAAAMEQTGCDAGLLLTSDEEQTGTALAGPGSVETVSLWHWLLDPQLRDVEVSTDTAVRKETTALPKHLL